MATNKEYPLFHKDSNPNLSHIVKLADKLYQWDGTSNKPIEIQNSDSAMPPAWNQNEYVIWTDTHTMGHTNVNSAAPMYFSDLGFGGSKRLNVINHVAKRLNAGPFSDLTAAEVWATNESKIYVNITNNSNVNPDQYAGGYDPYPVSANKWVRAVSISPDLVSNQHYNIWNSNGRNATLPLITYTLSQSNLNENFAEGRLELFNIASFYGVAAPIELSGADASKFDLTSFAHSSDYNGTDLTFYHEKILQKSGFNITNATQTEYNFTIKVELGHIKTATGERSTPSQVPGTMYQPIKIVVQDRVN